MKLGSKQFMCLQRCVTRAKDEKRWWLRTFDGERSLIKICDKLVEQGLMDGRVENTYIRTVKSRSGRHGYRDFRETTKSYYPTEQGIELYNSLLEKRKQRFFEENKCANEKISKLIKPRL